MVPTILLNNSLSRTIVQFSSGTSHILNSCALQIYSFSANSFSCSNITLPSFIIQFYDSQQQKPFFPFSKIFHTLTLQLKFRINLKCVFYQSPLENSETFSSYKFQVFFAVQFTPRSFLLLSNLNLFSSIGITSVTDSWYIHLGSDHSAELGCSRFSVNTLGFSM